ncbi:MBL fold metallo-hydrolase [Candidatus Aalborgicola defluviihabitans]|uniref:MBL fold metallo-hydrolase n=1 Tax=Candidatus Aalborgicola defluviihabitans TaxID=3386187 RepID=UPI00390A7DC6|nr:MBL fold metallo-hydrolase [Burkholderiales bacterium]
MLIRNLSALLLGCLWMTQAVLAEPPAVHAVKVADKVWFVQGQTALGSVENQNFISNAGFIVTDDGVVVVDALGSPALAQAMIAEIRKVTAQPIRYVILTHYHADHIYGLQVFKAAGATVISHQEGREYLNSETAQKRLEATRIDLAPWIDAKTHFVSADRWLDGPETVLQVGSVKLLLHHVGPAHTPEDMVIFDPQSGVMFAGDIVFRGRIPFVGTADSRLWIQSLNKLLALNPRVVLPGHGPASFTPVADIELTRDYLLYLRKQMGAAAKNMDPFEQAYDKIDWSRYADLPLFKAANRMNAYNTYLLMEQQGEADVK